MSEEGPIVEGEYARLAKHFEDARFPRFREWLQQTGRPSVPDMLASELANALIEYVEDAVDRTTSRQALANLAKADADLL